MEGQDISENFFRISRFGSAELNDSFKVWILLADISRAVLEARNMGENPHLMYKYHKMIQTVVLKLGNFQWTSFLSSHIYAKVVKCIGIKHFVRGNVQLLFIFYLFFSVCGSVNIIVSLICLLNSEPFQLCIMFCKYYSFFTLFAKFSALLVLYFVLLFMEIRVRGLD